MRHQTNLLRQSAVRRRRHRRLLHRHLHRAVCRHRTRRVRRQAQTRRHLPAKLPRRKRRLHRRLRPGYEALLFSADKAANTVGHYDAYIKGKDIPNSFKFDLICPYKYPDKKIHISRKDANILAKEIQCDIVYIDPPYNSRQYSRFYHVLENIATWKKPELFGVACKPREENMSDYCRAAATRVFDDLITSLNCKYIAVSYNNTYNSKSSSSRNKITLEELERVLSKRGTVRRFEKAHQAFNAGKTELNNHKEFLFLVKVGE